MRRDWVDSWVVFDYDEWSDPVPGIKVYEQDLVGGELSPGARLLLLWLRFTACHGRLDECSKETLSKNLSAAPGTISRWLTELREGGLLDAFQGTWLADSEVGHVYFIQGESGGPIKIGKAVNPTQRLAQLQTGFHEQLKILGLIPNGGVATEKQLHERFAQYRVKGEWFLPCDEILELIRRL